MIKNHNYYNFILTVIDIFTILARDIPLKNKSGISETNGFKMVFGRSIKPENLWFDRDSEFYYRKFKSLLKEYKTEIYSTCSDLKSVFLERFNRALLQIFNKPMFIDGKCVNLLDDAIKIYNNTIR